MIGAPRRGCIARPFACATVHQPGSHLRVGQRMPQLERVQRAVAEHPAAAIRIGRIETPVPGEMHDVVAPLADERAELLHRHRLADELSVVSWMHEPWQALLEPLETTCDVPAFENADA